MGRSLGVALGLSLLVLGQARLALADCGKLCEGTLEEAVLDPPIECLAIETSLIDCGCKVHLSLSNDCQDPLTFSGDDLNCSQPTGDPCAIEVDSRGRGLTIRTHRAGAQTWSVKVEQGGSQHTLTVDGEITQYDDDLGCALAPARARRGPSWAGWALLAVSWLRRVRRRR